MTLSAEADVAVEGLPDLREVSICDLRRALEKAFDDYKHSWPISVPLALTFSLIGLYLLAAVREAQALQLVFPMIAGFALVGPACGVGFYQFSRLREANRPISAPALLTIGWRPFRRLFCLATMLMMLFFLWVLLADTIYVWAVNGEVAPTESAFWLQLTDPHVVGRLIGVGCFVGFIFAALVFCVSVISFPLLLEHDVGMAGAMGLSVKAVIENPDVMAKWAAFIVTSLVLASIPLLLGLAVAFPVLGHASWHLYRKVVKRNA